MEETKHTLWTLDEAGNPLKVQLLSLVNGWATVEFEDGTASTVPGYLLFDTVGGAIRAAKKDDQPSQEPAP